MESILPLFLAIPLLGFVLSLITPRINERAIYLMSLLSSGALALLSIFFTIWWACYHAVPINVKEITLYEAGHYSFFIDLLFDEITAVYCIISSILTFIISMYSRVYMHKDPGYKRFFNTLILFYFSVQIIIFSGNFETLFIGWEILGVSSFLLIAFYRERYMPVRNAFKVFSMYRLADIGILLTMWLSHHLWHENITFLQLENSELVHTHIQEHTYIGVIISIALVVSASIKSAQFPFSSWLPRAMEGPTPSSAIFYGSIAVHIGVFLLLRTYPFWSDLTVIKIGVIVLGLFTSFIATISSRVQSSIKAQIAYSSVAQIGLIFVEVALGLEMIALIHLTGNAFLRSYQLLISPSVVTYLIREQFFNYAPVKERKKKTWTRIITNSFYVIGLKEWHMDNNLYRFLWYPLKRVGYLTTFLTTLNSSIFTLIVIVGSFFILNTEAYEHLTIQRYIPVLFGLIGLLFVLRAFTDRGSSTLAWTLLTLNHFWIVLAVAFNERFDTMDIVFYLSGVLIASISGYIVLHLLRKKEKFDLNNFYGHATEHKALGFYFLLSCLALAGFPITSTFLGEDLLFTHIHEDQIFLAILISINFVVTGIAVIRMYSRIFMGPNRKWYQPNARRSA